MFFASGRLLAGVRLHCPRPQWVRLSLIAHDPLPVLPSGLARQHEKRQSSHSSLGLVSSRRFYADVTVSRPKAHKGRTTRKIRAKKNAAPKTAIKDASVAKPKAKKKATSPKKATAKSKLQSKSKPKPKPKPKKKILTDEQKKKKAERNASEKLRELRKIALPNQPKELPSSGWTVFMAERQSKALKGTKIRTELTALLSNTAKQSSIAYKELSPKEIEHYNHVANQNKEKNSAAYHTWITSHTPKEIQAANKARHALFRLNGKNRGREFQPLRDERLIRRPASAYIIFSLDRFATGDYKGIKLPEAASLIAQEWKALPDHEKTLYKEKSDKERETYARERTKVYGE